MAATELTLGVVTLSDHDLDEIEALYKKKPIRFLSRSELYVLTLLTEVKRLRKAASLLKAADLVCEKARDYEFLLLDENATDEAAAFEVMVVGRHLKAIYDANHVYQQVKAAALTEEGE